MSLPTAAEVSALPVAEFVAKIGGIYEKTPWIAEKAHAAGPFDSLAALRDAMANVVNSSDSNAQLELLRAHPDLAGKAAIAYAVHKAASPIRFPPTVMLTPIVSNFLARTPAAPAEED